MAPRKDPGIAAARFALYSLARTVPKAILIRVHSLRLPATARDHEFVHSSVSRATL